MRKNLHNGTQVPITVANLIHRFLYWVVFQLILRSSEKPEKNPFKQGEIVRYNWKAKVYLGNHLKEYNDLGLLVVVGLGFKRRENRPEVNQVVYDRMDGSEGSCDSYWLRKAYFWELP